MLPPAEHAECAAGVGRKVKALEKRLSLAGQIGYGDFRHFVHAVMLDQPGLPVKADQIIVFIVPQQGPWADLVGLPAVAVLLYNVPVGREFDPPLEIAEGYLHPCGNRLMQGIYIIVDAFVEGFGAPGDIDLALERRRLRLAGQPFQLVDELTRFAVGDEARRLDRVDQQLQLRSLERPGRKVIAPGFALVLHDIQPKIT